MWCLDRQHIVARVFFACHEQTKLLHTLSSAAGLRLSLGDLAASSFVAVFLIELVLAPLALLLKTFDNVNRTTDVDLIVLSLRRTGRLEADHGSRSW